MKVRLKTVAKKQGKGFTFSPAIGTFVNIEALRFEVGKVYEVGRDFTEAVYSRNMDKFERYYESQT